MSTPIIPRSPTSDRPTRKRILLLTHPRSASNLLIRILDLPSQQKVFTNGSLAGYHFIHVSRVAKDLTVWDRPYSDWSEQVKTSVSECIEKCATALDETVRKGEEQGKVVFVKEHVHCILRMDAQSRFLFGAGIDDIARQTGDDRDLNFLTGRNGPHDANGLCSSGTFGDLNDTVLADTFLTTWTPIFLIRHPALSFPSMFRIMRGLEADDTKQTWGDENERIEFGEKAQRKTPNEETKARWNNLFMTLHWTRRSAEWFSSQSPCTAPGTMKTPPLIIDAADIISPFGPALLAKLAAEVGLDASQFQFQWPSTNEADLSKKSTMERRMLVTLHASEGVIVSKDDVGEICLEREKEKWMVEFGEEGMSMLEGWVENAMADYTWLRERRLRVV